MKKILTYEDFINCSMNEIEENIVKHTYLYSYSEIRIVNNIFKKIIDKFTEYETKIEQINIKLIIVDKNKKINELFKYYDDILREVVANKYKF